MNAVDSVSKPGSTLKNLKRFASLVVAVVIVVAAMNWHGPDHSMRAAASGKPAVHSRKPLVELVDGTSDTIRLVQGDAASLLGLKLVEVRSAPSNEPLRLPGTLALDPNRLIHVHSRFDGEAVSIGQIRDADGKMRPLQYGDRE